LALSNFSGSDIQYGICKVSVASLRRKPEHFSEQVSQLLFGECVLLILRQSKKWYKVQCVFDDVIAWVDPKQIQLVDEKSYFEHQRNLSYSIDLLQSAMGSDHAFPIPIGANLPDFDGMSFRLLGHKYGLTGQTISPENLTITPELFIKLCKKFIHAPFQWGGRSPLGIDAAGFTQLVYKLIGIKIGRSAEDQSRLGTIVDFAEHAAIGDLAFFENKEGFIHHVGIVLPDKQIIHVSGQVRIDFFDHQGIYRQKRRRYTHHLRIIKKILPTDFGSDRID
jgi:hypothetical protein